MKLQEKLEFLNYYYDNVIEDLKNTYNSLKSETVIIQSNDNITICRKKYNNAELFNIMLEMMNPDELIYFYTEILKEYEMNGDIILIDIDYIFTVSKEYMIRSLYLSYEEYFRNERRRLRNIEKKNKEYIE